MPWFIKTEKFTASTEQLTPIKRALYIDKHRLWVSKVRSLGIKIFSGYLVNENHRPGGGGLLIFEEISFQKAKDLVLEDPMIKAGIVEWELNEWVPLSKDENAISIEGEFS